MRARVVMKTRLNNSTIGEVQDNIQARLYLINKIGINILMHQKIDLRGDLVAYFSRKQFFKTRSIGIQPSKAIIQESH